MQKTDFLLNTAAPPRPQLTDREFPMTMTVHSLDHRSQMLVALISGRFGLNPDPDGPEVGPNTPWGPIITQAYDHVRTLYGPQPEPWRLDRVALNPQPLPPRWMVAGALALALTGQTARLQELAQALPREAQGSVEAYRKGLITRFVDDCGNGLIVIHLPKHGPFPPGDDEPKPIGPEEQLVIGALLSAARGQPDLQAAGLQLLGGDLHQP